nr:hypothetical protein [Kouleothrix sp.]
MDGPTKGLQTITLLSQDARLKGRPKLCSDCGFCDTSMRPLMAQSCVFVENRTAAIEQRGIQLVPAAVVVAVPPAARLLVSEAALTEISARA